MFHPISAILPEGFRLGLAGLHAARARRGPETQQVFRKITHAGALQAFLSHPVAERRGHLASFPVVIPEFRLQRDSCRMRVSGVPGQRGSNFFAPVLSLVRVFQQIIVHQLLRSIQAHGRQPARRCPENNRKPASKAGLQFSGQMLTVR